MWCNFNSCRIFQEFVKEESEVRSRCNVKRSALEDAVHDLEERVGKGLDGEIQEEDLDGLLVVSLDNLTSAKKVYSFYAIDSLYASSASCSWDSGFFVCVSKKFIVAFPFILL